MTIDSNGNNGKSSTKIIRKDTGTIPTLGRVKKGGSGSWLKKSNNYRLLILIITVLLTIIFFPFTASKQSFNLPIRGAVSDETVIAPITFDILKSERELEKDKEFAKQAVLLVFNKKNYTRSSVSKKLLELKNDISTLSDTLISDSILVSISTKLQKVISEKTITLLQDHPFLLDDIIFQANDILDKGIISILLVESENKLSNLRNEYNSKFINHLFYNKKFITILEDTVETTVRISDVSVKEMALDKVMKILRMERVIDQDALNSVYELLDLYLQPNIVLDGEETSKRQQAAQKAVLLTKGKVIKDTEIIRKHQLVTDAVLEKLLSLHLALEKGDSAVVIAKILRANISEIILILILFSMLIFYAYKFHKPIYRNDKHLTALISIALFQIAIIRISLFIVPPLFANSVDVQGFNPELIIPMATASILTVILFNFNMSIIMTLFTAIYFGTIFSFNFSYMLYVLIGGVITGYVTRNVRYRWDFFKVMPIIFATFAFVIVLWSLITYEFNAQVMLQNIGIALISAIIAIFLAMLAVTLFETIFDITTNMTLVELSDMNHPLLKKLSIEAAGTYNHSVLVANLAESAAEMVNANPLLVRVAAYYHDVGKINKPTYFSENQRFEKNKHDKLEPSMSALIIANHVKDGLEMAKVHKLPSVIRDVIMQHHGDNLVSFFYQKALELDPSNSKQIKKSEFSYPGPKPQTKENAIIMLADSVEAASRSLATSSPKMLRNLVKKIIYDKFQSSQLDECDLTFKELDMIIDGFMPVLQGIFHTRVEYPNKKQE